MKSLIVIFSLVCLISLSNAISTEAEYGDCPEDEYSGEQNSFLIIRVKDESL